MARTWVPVSTHGSSTVAATSWISARTGLAIRESTGTPRNDNDAGTRMRRQKPQCAQAERKAWGPRKNSEAASLYRDEGKGQGNIPRPPA